MKKLITFVAVLSLGAASAAFAESREDTQKRMDNAGSVLHEIMAAPDKGIPEEVLDHAKCVVLAHLTMRVHWGDESNSWKQWVAMSRAYSFGSWFSQRGWFTLIAIVPSPFNNGHGWFRSHDAAGYP